MLPVGAAGSSPGSCGPMSRPTLLQLFGQIVTHHPPERKRGWGRGGAGGRAGV